MKMIELTDAEHTALVTRMNQLMNEFEKEFEFGLRISAEEGKGILGTSLTLARNGSCPFWFKIDELSSEIGIEAVIDNKLRLIPSDIPKYQRRYKRRSKKYTSFCNKVIKRQKQLIELQNKLDKFIPWFDKHGISHIRILDQIRESDNIAKILVDIEALRKI